MKTSTKIGIALIIGILIQVELVGFVLIKGADALDRQAKADEEYNELYASELRHNKALDCYYWAENIEREGSYSTFDIDECDY